jgi:hypothetical protein
MYAEERCRMEMIDEACILTIYIYIFMYAYIHTHSKAKGYEIGCELGYYKACCQTWLAVLRSGPLPAAAVVKRREGEGGEEDAATEASAAVAMVMDETTKERCVSELCFVSLCREMMYAPAPPRGFGQIGSSLNTHIYTKM